MLINNRQLSSLSNELREALWRDFRQNAEHSVLSEHFAALLPHTSPRPSETGGNQISDSVLGRLLELDHKVKGASTKESFEYRRPECDHNRRQNLLPMVSSE